MNIHDKRTVAEQVKSGFRLVGWLLLALASIYALLLFASLVVGRTGYDRPIYRIAGACGLAAMSLLLFATVQTWLKWFVGAIVYLVLKTLFALLLGSSLIQPRLWFAELALLLGIAVLLCMRYVTRKPKKPEAAALVALLLTLSLTLVLNSTTPVLIGVAVLAITQLAYARKHRTPTFDAG